MKIAIVAHSVFPLGQPYKGGLENFIHVLATRLADAGIDTTLYCHTDTPEGSYHKVAFTDFNYNFDNCFDSLNRDYSSLLKELSSSSSSFDLIHNNSLNKDILKLSALKIPLLTTIHVPPIPHFKEAVYENFLNKNCFYNIVSHACLKSWTALSNCKVIHNGIDSSTWKIGRKEKKEKRAIWFGRICREKGVERAILASKRAGFHLVIAGIINDYDYYDYLERNYNSDFSYVGLCNHTKLNSLIKESQVFVNAPLWEEPFGLVYLESLASGTPIATYSSNISKELLNSSVAAITDNNIDALAEGITKASTLDSLTCRKYVEEKFNIETMVHNYIQYYREILCIS